MSQVINIYEIRKDLAFEVKVLPRSARNAVAGVQAGVLRIKLQAPPADGEANKALIDYLALLTDIPRKNLTIIKGWRHHQKTIKVSGLNKSELSDRFSLILSSFV